MFCLFPKISEAMIKAGLPTAFAAELSPIMSIFSKGNLKSGSLLKIQLSYKSELFEIVIISSKNCYLYSENELSNW